MFIDRDPVELFGDLSYHSDVRYLYGPLGHVRLTKQEGMIVGAMIRRPGRLVHRDQVMSMFYDDKNDVTGSPRMINVHIHAIRAKMMKIGTRLYIVSHRGAGYSLRESAL